jgi:hypothetical protein
VHHQKRCQGAWFHSGAQRMCREEWAVRNLTRDSLRFSILVLWILILMKEIRMSCDRNIAPGCGVVQLFRIHICWASKPLQNWVFAACGSALLVKFTQGLESRLDYTNCKFDNQIHERKWRRTRTCLYNAVILSRNKIILLSEMTCMTLLVLLVKPPCLPWSPPTSL